MFRATKQQELTALRAMAQEPGLAVMAVLLIRHKATARAMDNSNGGLVPGLGITVSRQDRPPTLKQVNQVRLYLLVDVNLSLPP